MLITYRRATGEILDNTGTNSEFPEGPPDDEHAYINTDRRKINRSELSFLRLHDEKDATLVNKILSNRCHVEGGVVIIDGELVVPSLKASQSTIKAGDARSYSTVTLTRIGGGTASFNVNGLAVSEPIVDNTASIEIAANEPGPVLVTCDGFAVTINSEV